MVLIIGHSTGISRMGHPGDGTDTLPESLHGNGWIQEAVNSSRDGARLVWGMERTGTWGDNIEKSW